MALSRHVTASILLTAALMAQEPGDSTFHAATTTVLVPFNVQRGKYFAADLQPSDFTLLEDGHPRQFTVFEGPNTPHPLPLELVLVFDTSRLPKKNPYGQITSEWNAKAEYEFLDNWDEATVRTVLGTNGMDIRLSVYHFDDGHLERLCGASSDPHEIGDAFRKLLNPIPAGSQLTLLPGDRVYQGRIMFSTGWWEEATVAALRDVAGSPVAARRVMFVFSQLSLGGTVGTPWQAVGNEAVALGIEVNPVILGVFKDTSKHITTSNMGPGGFSIPVEAGDGSTRYGGLPASSGLGEMTGGEALTPEHLNREALANTLQRVRDQELSKYLVGFVPDPAPKPGKHKLQVELKSKSAGKIVGGEREGVVY